MKKEATRKLKGDKEGRKLKKLQRNANKKIRQKRSIKRRKRCQKTTKRKGDEKCG